jgi:hypothetical protein
MIGTLARPAKTEHAMLAAQREYFARAAGTACSGAGLMPTEISSYFRTVNKRPKQS